MAQVDLDELLGAEEEAGSCSKRVKRRERWEESKLTLVVSSRDEVVEQTLENGNDVGRDEYAAVKKTAQGFTEISELLLGVVVTLGL